MADAKKVQIEITGPKAIIPQSVHETIYLAKVAQTGEVVEVYQDVADKLVSDNLATVVTKDQPATIAKDAEEASEAEKDRRKSLLTGEQQEEKPKKK